jgi:hypothetical protein
MASGTYQTLSQAVEALNQDLVQYRIELSNPEAFDQWIAHSQPGSDPMEMREVVTRGCFEIASYRGRGTRKCWQVVITRLDSGRWEPVSYPL